MTARVVQKQLSMHADNTSEISSTHLRLGSTDAAIGLKIARRRRRRRRRRCLSQVRQQQTAHRRRPSGSGEGRVTVAGEGCGLRHKELHGGGVKALLLQGRVCARAWLSAL
jgi:hypothetical protein